MIIKAAEYTGYELKENITVPFSLAEVLVYFCNKYNEDTNLKFIIPYEAENILVEISVYPSTGDISISADTMNSKLEGTIDIWTETTIHKMQVQINGEEIEMYDKKKKLIKKIPLNVLEEIFVANENDKNQKSIREITPKFEEYVISLISTSLSLESKNLYFPQEIDNEQSISLYLAFKGKSKDITTDSLFAIISRKSKIKDLLIQYINTHFRFHSYVVRVDKIKIFYEIKIFIKLEIIIKVSLITNEKFYETIGYYETRLNSICNKNFQYDPKEISLLAEELDINIKGLSKDQSCKKLKEFIDKLTYSDFEH